MASKRGVGRTSAGRSGSIQETDWQQIGHDLGNVSLLIDAAIRSTPDHHETVELLVEAKRRLDEISRSVVSG